MKKKKVIVTILIIVAASLLIAGGILTYLNYSNMTRIVTSFKDLKEEFEKTFNYNSTLNEVTKETVTGKASFYINPIFGNSDDGTDVIINNLNNTTLNYEYRFDEELKKMYFNGSLLLGANEMLGINYYQSEDISYIFLRNIFDKYITIEDNDIFKYLEDNETTKEDIDYIYNKMVESLENNITNDDILVSKDNEYKKISLKLDSKRYKEISNNIINDLKNDKKAKEILGSSIKAKEILDSSINELDTTNNNSKFNAEYNIYLLKNEISKYELNIKDDTDDYTIAFNVDNEKTIIFTDNISNETFKAVIKSNDGITTSIEFINNDISLGTITMSENNIDINLIVDPSANTVINAKITNLLENNIGTSTIKVALNNNGVNMDVLTINNTYSITSGVADFSNINTTNNVNINNLTDTDITNIQNNLMMIFYNYLGMGI